MKNKVGRPLKFETVEILKNKIDKYFKECKETKEPLTITGLALALDTSRETLMDYENTKGQDFSDTIKRAKDKIQNEYEKRLINRGNAGDIFALKNFGWRDRQEIEQTITQKSLKEVLEDLEDTE